MRHSPKIPKGRAEAHRDFELYGLDGPEGADVAL